MSKVTVIGAGNVGTHIALRLIQCGHQVIQVFSRSIEKATSLANKTQAVATDSLTEIGPDADFYILAVHDDAIKTVAEKLVIHKKGIIAHTSGTVSSSTLSSKVNYGVFYPLQTFSLQQPADFNQLPFCIYGNNNDTERKLLHLAQSICPNTYLIDDNQRASLHVAAVFVNNFSNFMFSIDNDICSQKDVSFKILQPLIEETVKKIKDHPPFSVQTGPAIRGDIETMQKHINSLSSNKTYQEIYQLISQAIINKKSKL